MEGVRTFLESSSIHGLTYISSTRKYVRLFWILVVISGFVGISLLIKESFDSWSDSPVKTTIETLPISKIKLPKVTVCPPKDTYTDLNYDLMMTENITLSNQMRDHMFKYALEILDEDIFSQNNWTKLHDEDRSYNWYHGYTEIKSPYYDDGSINIYFYTSATSGVVTTQYYGEKFDSDLVDKTIFHSFRFYPPKSALGDENVTLHIKLEKVSMKGSGIQDDVNIEDLGNVDADQTTVYKNYTPPGIKYSNPYQLIILFRNVSSEDIEVQKLDVMPGFRFSWWYTGKEVTPYKKYKNKGITKQFFR